MCPRLQYTDLTYMEGTGFCGTMRIIFGSITQSWYTSPNIKFMRTGRSMCPTPQYTNLTYMEGAGFCGLMKIIFGSVIQSW